MSWLDFLAGFGCGIGAVGISVAIACAVREARTTTIVLERRELEAPNE